VKNILTEKLTGSATLIVNEYGPNDCDIVLTVGETKKRVGSGARESCLRLASKAKAGPKEFMQFIGLA